MKVVVDANVLLSALLTDGATRRRLFTAQASLLAPAHLQSEVAKYRDQIAKRAELAPEQAQRLLDRLFEQVRWVPDARIEPSIPEAGTLLEETDPDDVAYLACALATEADAIWSHDADFDEQDRIPRTTHPDEVPP